MKKEKVIELKIRKGQKCRLCKKEIKKSWCYNGYWWDTRCKDKDTKKKVRDYLALKRTGSLKKWDTINMKSQKQQILEILSDYHWHSSYEFQERMFGSTKYGLFRLGARIWDIKQAGHTIEGKHDPERQTIYWYRLIPKLEPKQMAMIWRLKEAVETKTSLWITPFDFF